MYPAQFEYYRAESVKDAVAVLKENPDAKIIAGGHSLLPAMKLRLAMPGTLVDIGRVDGLSGIRVGDDAKIGAMTTYRELMDSAELAKAYPMLVDAAGRVGDPAVRARGTFGGSLAHSDPAADLTAVALALNAKVEVVGTAGSRTIDVDDLFVSLLTTSLETDEVITSIKLSSKYAGAPQAYEKHAHPASGYAVVGVAVALNMDGDKCKDARIAVTGAPEFAMRAKSAEKILEEQGINEESIAAAAAIAADDLGELNADVYASADYRKHLVGVLTGRAVRKAVS